MRHWVWVLLMSVMLSGCSLLGLGSKGPEKTDLKSIKLVAAADANQTTATAIDFLFVYDSTVEPLLPTTAVDWFTRKSVLVAAMGNRMDVVSLQVPPAMIIDEVALPSRHKKAIYVVAFANYLAKKGQFPTNLTGFTKALVTLKKQTISYQELDD